MSSFAITGAGGFIGRALARRCLAQGHQVIALTRKKVIDGEWISWQLGDPLPDACATVDAVIHLASATLVARDNIAAAVELDFSGTMLLAQGTRDLRPQGHYPRFIFLSSQSAHVAAKNAYGKSKLKIENSLLDEQEIIVQPGLVYDDEGSSVYGLFEKLAKLPVIPVVSNNPSIQPIHINDLLDCIIKIALIDSPQKKYYLGRAAPMTFAEAIEATAKRSGRKPPLMIPIPLAPIKAAAWLVDVILRVKPPIGERVDGLVALQPMNTVASLQTLYIELPDFEHHLDPIEHSGRGK